MLKRPLIVLRNSTERPEAVNAGFARRVVPGAGLPDVLPAAVADPECLPRLAALPSPYGDGPAGEQITRAVERLLDGAAATGSRAQGSGVLRTVPEPAGDLIVDGVLL